MKIIVLAGGMDQIALIQELKNRGHIVILVDYFENPIAKNFADKHIVASTLDVEVVQKITINEQAELIVTACTDQALLTVAKVSEELDLPCYISYKTAMNVTNKFYMKEIFEQKNIPTSKYITINNTNLKDSDNLKFPLVVKPADCNSSKGVIKCFSKMELNNALNNALNLSRTKTAIVEEFKQGIEISADFYIQNGKAILLCATSSKKRKNTNSFTITQSYYPILTKEQEIVVENIGQKIAIAFNLKDTPMLVQFILTAQGDFSVLEFSARMGGGSKHKLIEILSGVNIMSIFVDLVLGQKPIIKTKKQVNYASMNYVYCESGIFTRLVNFDDLLYFQYKTEGTKIDKAETSSDRVAGFLLTADTEEQLVEKIKLANSNIKVLDNFGKDIARHDLIEETI
jgi:phosphoribosylamine-glycine ligase